MWTLLSVIATAEPTPPPEPPPAPSDQAPAEPAQTEAAPPPLAPVPSETTPNEPVAEPAAPPPEKDAPEPFSEEAPAALEVTVSGKRTPSDPTVRVLESDVIRTLPGANGDAVRAVQNLPGVLRPPLGVGSILVRGTAPEDSATFLDGGRIPLVFHFSGLSTVVNADLLSEVAFLPGNASVRFGRLLGGVIDLRTDFELPESSTGTLSVDFIQATARAAQPIGERAAIVASVRRSYIDAILTPVLSSADMAVRAPRYYDGQVRLFGETRAGTRWEFMALGSDDAFRIAGGDDQPPDAIQIGLGTTFWRARGRAFQPLDNGWQSETMLMTGHDLQTFTFEVDGRAEERAPVLGLRQEFGRPLAPGRPGLRLGLDFEGSDEQFVYDVPSFGPAEAGGALRIAPAAYAEATVRTGPLTWIPGVRADYWWLDLGKSLVHIEPRGVVRAELSAITDLRLAAGLTGKAPTVRQVHPGSDGNPDLGHSEAWQVSAALETRPARGWSAEVTPFGSFGRELIVGREDRLQFFSGPPPAGELDTGDYANEGVSRIFGVESLVRVSRGRWFGLLSATWSRSERRDREADPWTLFTYDQPLALTALASFDANKGWQLGVRGRYGTGNPYHPVSGRTFDLDSRTYFPTFSETSERLPPFIAFDLRADKTWTFRTWELTASLELQNLTPVPNVEIMAWSDDYGEEEPLVGIPPIPVFGLRGDW